MRTTTEDTDETEIWRLARAGDADAFGRIFDLHRDRVFGQALRLVRSVHDAEDVTALTFLELWRKRATVEPVDGSIIGWLLVTANFVVRNVERARRRHRAAMSRLPEPSTAPDHSERVDAILDAGAEGTTVRDAFRQLSPIDQDILTVCVLQELTGAQAAAALGIAKGTVKSRLFRAKRRLADLVDESGERILLGGNNP